MRNLHRYRNIILLLLMGGLVLGGCQKKKEEPNGSTKTNSNQETTQPASLTASPLLRSSQSATVVETAGEAIPIWRQFRNAHPVLVVFSNDPFMGGIPPELADAADKLVRLGTTQDFKEKASRPSANPILFPRMAATAALREGLASEFIWVVPTKDPDEKINLTTFKNQLLEYGAGSPAEIESLQQNDAAISGELHGHPFRAVTLGQLPPLKGPALVHIDLSFFAPIYQHEIGTPLYPLLFKVLSTLRRTAWPTLSVTISSSNLAGVMPLSTRFLGPTLKQLFAKPEMLDQPLPKAWKIRAQALYLANFFKKEDIRKDYLELEKMTPDDPSIQYALFQTERQFQKGNKALEYLAKAVTLDPIYGYAYLDLVPVAMKQNRVDAALKMLDLADAAFPENPFIIVTKAKVLADLGHTEQVQKIVSTLKQLSWSKVYFPHISSYLDGLVDQARRQSMTMTTPATPRLGNYSKKDQPLGMIQNRPEFGRNSATVEVGK